jgi:hypothetical protein
MELLNGEVRDREKVMRGIKRMDSPIFKGYQLYHCLPSFSQKAHAL